MESIDLKMGIDGERPTTHGGRRTPFCSRIDGPKYATQMADLMADMFWARHRVVFVLR